MANLTYLCLFISLAIHCSCGQQEKKFFRKDYHFIESEKSFYKIHVLHLTWQDAKHTCEMEGATLYHPDNEAESTAVLAYVKEAQDLHDIWLGVSSLLAKGVFVTTNGTLVMDVYHKWNRYEPNNAGDAEDCVMLFTSSGTMNDVGCSNKKPYICKKTLTSLEWSSSCNTPYTGYTYNETLGKCYKFHFSPKKWTEAYTVCSSELSYLAVIDSQDEFDFIYEELASFVPEGKAVKNCMSDAAFLGFHNKLGEGWRTVKGVSIEANELLWWGESQPNDDGKQCGAMMEARIHDMSCDLQCFFVCEHDICQ